MVLGLMREGPFHTLLRPFGYMPDRSYDVPSHTSTRYPETFCDFIKAEPIHAVQQEYLAGQRGKNHEQVPILGSSLQDRIVQRGSLPPSTFSTLKTCRLQDTAHIRKGRAA